MAFALCKNECSDAASYMVQEDGEFTLSERFKTRTMGIRYESYVPPKPRARSTEDSEKEQEPESDLTEDMVDEQLDRLRAEPSLFVDDGADRTRENDAELQYEEINVHKYDWGGIDALLQELDGVDHS